MSDPNLKAADVLGSAEQWPHRFIEGQQWVRFLPVDRDLHRRCTFITDEYLPPELPATDIPLETVRSTKTAAVPMHFIFHSAYCCSTMLARAFDIEGVAMGLKEPQYLNDMVGWRRRGASEAEVREALGLGLQLLERPFGDDRAVVVKPSNFANPLAPMIGDLRPNAQILLLHAPIRSFLASIAKKGLWGRRWVRQLLIGHRQDGILVGGFDGDALLELTDFQVAAIGWLSQHAVFQAMVARLGPQRVRTLASDALLADQRGSLIKVADHFGLELTGQDIDRVMAGPAFTTHSKTSAQFTAQERESEQREATDHYGEEIDLVATWCEAVAQSQGIKMAPDAAL